MVVDFRMLGPLEVSHPEAVIDLGTPKQRAILVLLLLEVNRPVTASRMVNELWADRAPHSAVANVTSYVSRLRRTLAATGCALERRGVAYVLRTRPDSIDMYRFAGHAERGDAAWRNGDAGAATPHWEQALATWRGDPFDGVPAGHELDAARAELSERRLTVFERYAWARVRLGQGAELVADLRRHTLAEPLRETGWLLLMASLRLSGNSAAALDTYEQARLVLAEQLGADPGARLRALHHAILRDDSDAVRAALDHPDEPAGPPGRAESPVVAQLPATARQFLGRDTELARLDTLVLDAPSVTVITGTAGIGKTALAVNWARRATGAFPDGQLFVDLRGFAPGAPVTPQEALTGFLLALGVTPERIPVDLGQQAGLYRSLMTVRRMLVLLDNAADTAQVRLLLPGAAHSAVVVTSRGRLGELAALYDAHHLALAPLASTDSVELLAGARPGGWSPEERPLADDLAELCGHLPLSLRIAAANLRLSGRSGLADQLARLRAGRLDALVLDGADDFAVRTTFDYSYAALPPEVRRLYRLVGAAPGPDLAVAAAAALADQPLAQTQRQLDQLTEAHLLDVSDDLRYRMHDLVRAYAVECFARDETPERRQAAIGRFLDFYLHTVRAATDLACPMGFEPLPAPGAGARPLTFDAEQDAMAWLERERPSLVAAVRHAAESSNVDTAAWAWTCTRHLQRYFWFRRHSVDWLIMGEAALAAARRVGDVRAQGRMLNFLGVAHWALGAYDTAIELTKGALEVCERLGVLTAQAASLSNLSGLYRAKGDPAQAVAYGERSVMLYDRLNDPIGHANAELNLAMIRIDIGDLDRAAAQLTRVVARYRANGYADGEASALGTLGVINEHRGRRDDAIANARDALAMLRDNGSRVNRIGARAIMLTIAADADSLAALVELVAEARELQDAEIEADTLCRTGTVAASLGRYAEAADHFLAALTVARNAGERHLIIDAQAGLAAARCHLDPTPERLVEVREAVDLAAANGLTIRRSTALTIEAEIALRLGEPARAAEAARAALDVHVSCGAEPWRRRAQAVLDRARPV
jgi:DNA-binding SARP family transcriptional activator/tetratricopeptide (TPR) repeat protein